MPLYDIEHTTPLTPTQQEQLAQALTAAHASRFRTPRIFVNPVVFRGGVRRPHYNRVVLRTRAAPSSSARSDDLYIEHCRQVVEEWERVVGSGSGSGSGGDEKSLRTVWVMGALTTALEMGIARPKVGGEEVWLEKNMSRFKELAAQGDEDFIELVNELETRAQEEKKE